MATFTHITVEYSFQDRIATVTLRRPQVHNAFNAVVLQDLMTAFTELGADERLHAIVLTGEQNLEDALRLADLLDTINNCPCPVVARVNGTAMGGGVGLIAVCDIAIAAESARFAFSEVKLGIAPP